MLLFEFIGQQIALIGLNIMFLGGDCVHGLKFLQSQPQNNLGLTAPPHKVLVSLGLRLAPAIERQW